MELLHKAFTILRFDHTYDHQRKLKKSFPFQTIDLADISGKNLYCDPLAEAEIHRRLNFLPSTPGVTLIGNGNYHYATYLLLSKIHKPFTLCLIDHHPDLTDHGELVHLSCGSWVLWALRQLHNLEHVVIIGPEAYHINSIPRAFQDKVTLVPEALVDPEEIVTNLANSSIYVSIDKDVLNKHDARTKWDHGHMTLETLTDLTRHMALNKQLAGLDICGEWAYSDADRFVPINQIAIHKNERANLAILEATISNPNVSLSVLK